MNLIGNCCLSSYLLRLCGFGNTNPFTWIDMNFTSFYNLLTNYDNIDFDKFELTYRPHPYFKNQIMYEIVVDNQVTLTFIHHKNPNQIVEKYKKHLDIMRKNDKEPMFALEWEHLDYNEEAFMKMYNLPELKYKVAVITYNTNLRDLPSKENLLVIYDPHGRGGGYKGAGNKFPDWYAQTYSDRIKNFMYK